MTTELYEQNHTPNGETVETNEEPLDLREKLSQLQYLLRKRHALIHRGGPTADTTRGQGRILAFLKLKDGIKTRDLAYLLNIHVSSLNELLAKLEKNGYIRREPSSEDKRVMLVYLTEKGRTEEQAEPAGDVFGCLSEEEQAAFGSYLERIIANLEEQLGESAPAREELRRRRQAFFAGSDPHGGHRGSGPHGPGGHFGPGGFGGPDSHGPRGHHGPDQGFCGGFHRPERGERQGW